MKNKIIEGRSKASELHFMEIYEKYEKLALYYAHQVFNYHKLGMLKEDVEQEFRIKLLHCIKARSKAVKDYVKKKKEGKVVFPVIPMEFYLKAAFANLKKTMIGKISRNIDSNSIDDVSVGGTAVFADYTNLEDLIGSFKGKKDFTLIYNGEDLLQGLKTRNEKLAFILHLRGYSYRRVDMIMKDKLSKSCSNIIREHKKRLEAKKETIKDVFTMQVEDRLYLEDS